MLFTFWKNIFPRMMILLQSLLTHVSRATKNTLNKLGVFTVSSFHAFICARSPSLLNNLLAGRGATKRRPPMLSRSNSGSSRRSLQVSNIKNSIYDSLTYITRSGCKIVTSSHPMGCYHELAHDIVKCSVVVHKALLPYFITIISQMNWKNNN